jgi:hypothetical protein
MSLGRKHARASISAALAALLALTLPGQTVLSTGDFNGGRLAATPFPQPEERDDSERSETSKKVELPAPARSACRRGRRLARCVPAPARRQQDPRLEPPRGGQMPGDRPRFCQHLPLRC